MEGNQRCRRVEDAAEVVGDPGPAAEDVAFEARAAEDLAGAETVARFEGDAGLVPRCDEHRVEPSLGELETGEIAGELDPRQRAEQRQRGRQQGGAEDHHARPPEGRMMWISTSWPEMRAVAAPVFCRRELELEGGAEIVAGEMAEVEAFGGRSAGGDERVAGVGPPRGAGPSRCMVGRTSSHWRRVATACGHGPSDPRRRCSGSR